MQNDQAKRLFLAGKAMVEAVKEAGDQGVPGGVLYAALMGSGCTLENFERFMSALVGLGKLEKRGELYFFKQDMDVVPNTGVRVPA